MVVVGCNPIIFLLVRTSLQRKTKLQAERLEQLPSFHDGWSKGMYSSNTFCSCYWSLFWKSHSLVHWRRFSKYLFLLCDLTCWFLICVLEMKASMQRVHWCRLLLSWVRKEMTLLQFRAKATVKSPNTSQNIAWPTPKVPSYAEYLQVLF